MNRLFLFCIGGTGSRVLKSLLYLLAAGVKLPARQIIPIIIDPDKDNGDVEQVIRLLNYYQNIRKQIDPDKSDFFKVEVERLSNITDGDIAELSQEFRTDIASKGTTGETFKKFIGYDTLDIETKALLQMLYNEQTNLESDLTIGFKGNPHMGSIVLNRFQSSNDFKAFANKLSDKDAIFIVSSIFGGTGAAGFPLLVKNIREPHANYMGKAAVLKQVPLGAITVLPYFGIEKKDDSPIDKDTFINKTKAALSFYGNDLNGINALYYIGDSVHKDYANHAGGNQQRNHAHFIEMISALAIIDFANKNLSEYKTDANGVAINPEYKEFGIQTTSGGERYSLDFMNMGAATRQIIGPPLVRFFYATQFWKNQIAKSLGNRNLPFVKGNGGVSLPESLLTAPFFADNLSPLYKGFESWLQEIAGNQRSFRPFNFETAQLEEMIQNLTQEAKGVWPFANPKWDYKHFEDELNKAETQTQGLTAEQKLMTLFSIATQELYKERIESVLLG